MLVMRSLIESLLLVETNQISRGDNLASSISRKFLIGNIYYFVLVDELRTTRVK